MSFAPDTPLDPETGIQIVKRYELDYRLHKAQIMVRRKNLERLLRSHLERSIGASEVPDRENLDQALAGLSMLYIAGFDSPASLRILGLSPSLVREILENPWVRRYHEMLYPYAPPSLFRAALAHDSGDYQADLNRERRADGWVAAFRQFLIIDATFNAKGPLEYFLSILDDYIVDGHHLDTLKRAFTDEDRMERLVRDEAGRLIIEGIDDFFEFSEDLALFLESCEDYPLFRSLVWLNYGYWYGAGGERMRDVAGWVRDLLERQMGTQDVIFDDDTPRFERLHDHLVGLTDLDAFAGPTILCCPQTLEPWVEHVMVQRQTIPRSMA